MKRAIMQINSIDVTDYLISYYADSTYGTDISTATFSLGKTVASIIDLDSNQSVEVWIDSTDTPVKKVFDGYLSSFKQESGIFNCTAKDDLALMLRTNVTHAYDYSVPGDAAYPDGKISEVFKDLATRAGLSTNSGATVQDSGTTVTVTQLSLNNAGIYETCRKLAAELSWVFYYRPDTGFVYFEPKNATVNPTVIEAGVNVAGLLTWEIDTTEMVNDLTVEGSQQLVSGPQYFSGNASDTTFTLANNPEDLVVYYSASKNFATTARVANEAVAGNVTNSISTHDYEVDKKNKTITFTSFTPGSGTNNILVEYSYYVTVPVHLKDNASIAQYGLYQKKVNFSDITTLDDSIARAQSVLTKYKNPFRSAKIKVIWNDSYDLRVGQSIRVVDNVSAIPVDEYFTIYAVRDYWPQNITEIQVGDKQYTIEEYQANLVDRVKHLEDTQFGSGSAVTEISQSEVEGEWIVDRKTYDIYLINDTYIASHDVNGLSHATGAVNFLQDFEDKTNWTSSGISQTLNNDSTAGHFWVGTQGVNTSWSATSGTGTLTATISSLDVSSSTGASSGTPSKGTIGLWVYDSAGASLASISLRIGSSSSDYKEYSGQLYAQRNYSAASFSLAQDRNYVLFDLDNPSATSGAVNWTAVTYLQVRFAVAKSSNITFDYLSISEDNNIGMNGAGDRSTLYQVVSRNYGSTSIFGEFLFGEGIFGD